MATTVSTSLPPSISSSPRTRWHPVVYSASPLRRPCASTVHIGLSIPRPSFRHLCPWNGLKHLGISCRYRNRSKGRKERYIGRIYASLFGVGAPEALVIGVVALLVFGPKGLAEVARNLGQTLRAFQPTIKELQDVSREFKSTLEREIGLDETPPPRTNNSAYQSAVFDPNGTPPAARAPYVSEAPLNTTSDSEQQPQEVPNTSTSASSGSAENSQADGSKP